MMKKSVCLSQDSNLGSLIYLYGLIQPIRGSNRVKPGSSTTKLPIINFDSKLHGKLLSDISIGVH